MLHYENALLVVPCDVKTGNSASADIVTHDYQMQVVSE